MWKNLTKFFSETDYPNRQKKKNSVWTTGLNQ